MKTFDAAEFFDGQDFTRLMMEGGLADGCYEMSHWSVTFGDSTAESLRMLASLHEAMHARLNDSTVYGSLLHVYAYLLRNGFQPERTAARLGRLIKATRTAHECFATFTSVLAVGRGSEASGDLAAYPLYQDYLRQAQRTMLGLDGAFFRVCAANALFRLCLQPATAIRVTETGNLTRPEALDWLSLDAPDRRLRLLSENIDAVFWANVIAKAIEHHADRPEWTALDAHRRGDVAYDDLTGAVFDDIETALIHHIYAELAALLTRLGSASLAFDGHQPLTTALVAQADRLLPPGPRAFPLRAAGVEALSQDAINRDTVLQFAEERYVVRQPLAASLRSLDDLPRDMWAELVADDGGLAHLFVIARQASRIPPHYRFGPAETALLEELGDEPLVLVRRRVIEPDGSMRVDHTLLPDVERFTALVAWAESQELPIIANISLATLAVRRWAAIWRSPLEATGNVTVLLDLTPFLYLDRWTSTEERTVDYAFLDAQADGRPHKVFAAYIAEGGLPPLLAPCTTTVVHALGYYIGTMAPAREALRQSGEFLRSHMGAVQLSLAHLLGEEAFFDFLAAQCVSGQDMRQG